MASLVSAVVALSGCAAQMDRSNQPSVKKGNYHYGTTLTKKKFAGDVFKIHLQAPADATDVPLAHLTMFAAAETARENGFERFVVLRVNEHILTDEHALDARRAMLKGAYNDAMKTVSIRPAVRKRCRKISETEFDNCKSVSRYTEIYVIMLRQGDPKSIRAASVASVEKMMRSELSIN